MQPFTVQGTGSVTQKPDEAKISFTVTKTAPVLKDAQDQTNTQTNTIVSDLRKIGIAQKDIRTSNYSSYPIYNNSTIRMMPVRIPSYQTSRTITGYTVSENINVTLHNIIKANNVIDAITKDKAENISGPNLMFSNKTRQALVNKARIKAINNAKEEAQSMADAAGIHLGRIINIRENNIPYPIEPMMYGKTVNSTNNSATQINPGEDTITETVTLSYETW